MRSRGPAPAARHRRGASLPGGVDHAAAAVGAGSLGLVLLGISGALKRRRIHRRYEVLDD